MSTKAIFTDESFEADVLQSELPVLVDFWGMPGARKWANSRYWRIATRLCASASAAFRHCYCSNAATLWRNA